MNISKSPKINEALQKMGITDEVSLLNHLPRTYADFNKTRETGLDNKEKVVIVGKIVSNPTFVKSHRVTIISFSFITENANYFKIVAFNRPYLFKTLVLAETYTVIATYDAKKNNLNLINIIKGQMDAKDRIKPIYSLPNAIENYQFSNYVNKVLTEKPYCVEEIIPESLKSKYHLLSYLQCLKLVHNPTSKDDVAQGLRRLKYEECLLFTLQTQMIRAENKLMITESKKAIDVKKINEFILKLPYKLTHDQVVAVREIILDMNKTSLMYRLLQGDVGTGKTLVAAICLLGAILRGDQAALMAPTDALARQHYINLKNLFQNEEISVELYVGSLSVKAKNDIKKRLAKGEINLIIGTHALFSNDVIYQSLGLAVIDEQHRFGVNQRLLLTNKGDHADLLLMSATPIPRTLAFTLYGDLDISTLTEFPQGKRNIVTKILAENDAEIKNSINESLKNNKRVFIVAPLIDYEEIKNSVESLYVHYAPLFKGKVGLMHGKLEQETKEQILSDFIEGIKPILISTTVIEVGIDVKNADLMIIYHATNFGLASLHQIRGRIGRDGNVAKCLLLHQEEDEEIEKLEVLVSSNDGFKIAEIDLKMRGPGEMSGLRQSGLPNFNYVNIIDDFKMFEVARDDASEILQNKHNPDYKKILDKAIKLTNNTHFTNV